MKADFSILDLASGFPGIDTDSDLLRGRFAQDLDEFQSIFEPLNELVSTPNLLKGATVLNYISYAGNTNLTSGIITGVESMDILGYQIDIGELIRWWKPK